MTEVVASVRLVTLVLGSVCAVLALIGCLEDGFPPWRRAGVPSALNKGDTFFFFAALALLPIGVTLFVLS